MWGGGSFLTSFLDISLWFFCIQTWAEVGSKTKMRGISPHFSRIFSKTLRQEIQIFFLQKAHGPFDHYWRFLSEIFAFKPELGNSLNQKPKWGEFRIFFWKNVRKIVFPILVFDYKTRSQFRPASQKLERNL